MQEPRFEHLHAEIKLSAELCSRSQAVLRPDSLPLSQRPREGHQLSFQTGYQKVAKGNWNGKPFHIWKSHPLSANTQPLQKQIICRQIQVYWRRLSLITHQGMQTALFLWSLQQAHRVYAYKQPKSVKQHFFHPLLPLLSAKQHFLGTRKQHRERRMPGLIACSELQLPDTKSLCLYIRIKYFLHYTTNPISSFRKF